MLPPLDVSISSASNFPLGSSQGLLTTGSFSTSIPVTQLQSESLTNLTPTVLQQTVSIGDVVVSTAKEVMKRTIPKEPKEKVKRTKNTKKPVASKNVAMPPGSQKFTSNIGNQHTANMIGQQFPAGDVRSNKNNLQHPVTFQRVPAGSFVLSGASGQVRLQGGANILYLHQATTGAAQLLGTPIINTSSGAFTAVISSNLIGSNPSKINIVPSSNFKFSPGNPTITQQNKGLSAVISSGGCGNLVFTSTTAQLLASSVSSSGDTLGNISGDAQTCSVSASNTMAPCTVTPSTTVATTASSTIMTHLSANDLRYLASLIAKHSNSRPNSPMPSSLATSPLLLNKTDEKTLLKTSRENSDAIKPSVSSTCVSEVGINRSPFVSILDKKVTLNTANQSVRKVVQPPSLAQRVASIQQKDPVTKMKTPRMKTSKLATTMGHIISNTTKISSIPPNSKVLQKVPVTLTIPISRLPSNLNFSSASTFSKSINVPVLSSYLSHEKFILTSTKPSGSSPGSRTILTTPSVAKKSPIMVGNVPVCNNPGKLNNMAVFPCSRASSRTNSGGIFITKAPFSSTITPFKSPVKGKNPSPITLHLPSQAALKDPKVFRKTVSDVKVIGVLSQQAKSQIPSLVNLSALRSISNPSSPLRSPTNDSLHGDISPEELSPIQPREQADSGELKSEDRKKTTFSPLKSSIMAAIGDNFKPLTPPTIPSSTLLAASIPRDVNILGRSNITGKVGSSAFLGKLFVGPKSIVEPTGGKICFTKDNINITNTNTNITNQVSSFEHDMDDDDDDDDDEDDDDDDDDDDESDVDFAISPAVDSPVANPLVNKPVIFDAIKHSNITKIVYAPNQSNDKSNLATTSNLFSRNILDIARAKLRDTQCRCAGDGTIPPINTLKSMPESRSSLEDQVTSITTSDSKLRFEPLKISNTRAKLTSVLSMRENKFDESNTMNILQNTNIVTNPIIDTKRGISSAEIKLKENDINSHIVNIQLNRPITTVSSLSLKHLSTFHPPPITDFVSSRGLIARPSGEVVHDSVTFPYAVTNVVSSGERGGRNAEIKYNSPTTNGVTLHEIKGTPFSSKGPLFSSMETKETPFFSVDNRGVPFANIDTGKTSFSSIGSRGTSFAIIDSKGMPLGNIDTRGTPFANMDNKGRYLGNVENRGISFANIDAKATPFGNIDTKLTPITGIETKGAPSIESKWPLSNAETKRSSFGGIETKGTIFGENIQAAKLFAKPPKSSNQLQEYKMIIEEEPPPYITRSGRLMKSKYSIQYIDELDHKKTPKKRRLSSSTNQDNLPLNKKNKMSDMSQTSTVTLENLVEAAKLIKKESDSLVNGGNIAEKTVNHVNIIPGIDPTANIAATAMLELLSGDTKCIKVCKNIDDEMTRKDLDSVNEVVMDTSNEAERFVESPKPNSNCFVNTINYDNVSVESPGSKLKEAGSDVIQLSNMFLLSDGRSTALPSLASIEKETTETSAVNQDKDPRNVISSMCDKAGGVGLSPVTRNPLDSSLPILAPIQKISTGITNIPTVKLEQIPMKDAIADSADIFEPMVTDNCNDCTGSSPIPPLAAIQGKCSESGLALSIDLLNPVKRCELNDALSFNDDNINASTERQKQTLIYVPVIEEDRSKVAISNVDKNIEESSSQIEQNVYNSDSALTLTPVENSVPTLAVIQQPNAGNSVAAPCSDTLVEHTQVVSSVVATPIELVTNIPLLNEELKRSCEDLNLSESEMTMDESLDTKGTVAEVNKIAIPDSIIYSSANVASRLPNSSPPALAVIQNKGNGIPNMVTTDNCSLANTIPDITIVNSLPPLAAIQINSADCESLSKSNRGSLSNSESDLNFLHEPNKSIVKVEEGSPLLGTSLVDTKEDPSVSSISPVSKTLDVHDATNEFICTDNRTLEPGGELTEEDVKD